jgi:hypothetical protein
MCYWWSTTNSTAHAETYDGTADGAACMVPTGVLQCLPLFCFNCAGPLYIDLSFEVNLANLIENLSIDPPADTGR